MELRNYQVAAVDGVLAAWELGSLPDGRKPRVCLVAPTGAGKSEMSLAVLRRIEREDPQAFPLCIVHTTVLLEQTRRRFPGCTVLTIQGLTSKGKAGERRRERLSRHRVVFVDECHHLASEMWRQVLPFLAHARVFGATATPKRADGTPLGDVFDELVVAANYSELLRDGYLCRCDVARSEFTRSAQKKRKVRPDPVVAYLEQGKRADGSWRPGIFFDGTILQCEEAVARFSAHGLRAKVVTCNTGAAERQTTFNAYNAGELDMLASPMALSEGFDAPRAEVCVLARRCEGLGTYLQIVGRVLRPFAGKERALLIDCSGASEAGTHGLPTNDRQYSLTGEGISAPPEETEEDEEVEEMETPERVAARVLAAKYSLVRDTLHARYLDLKQEAALAGFKDGWVFHKFSEATSLVPPRAFAAKFASTCQTCRHRLKIGEDMFWLGSAQVQHVECWFKALDEASLATVPEKLPPMPRRHPRQAPVVSRQEFIDAHGGGAQPYQARDIGYDDIPF